MNQEKWEYHREYMTAVKRIGELAPEHKNSAESYRLYLMGLLFAPPEILEEVVGELKGTAWGSFVQDLIDSGRAIQEAATKQQLVGTGSQV